MVVCQPSKLDTRVRFPSLAQILLMYAERTVPCPPLEGIPVARSNLKSSPPEADRDFYQPLAGRLPAQENMTKS